MKLWLDDIRPAPEGWVHIKTAEQFRAVLLLHTEDITHISFDHDLGDVSTPEITGYTCLCWLEKMWYNDPRYTPPILTVHSQNPVGRQKMQRLIDKMQRG